MAIAVITVQTLGEKILEVKAAIVLIPVPNNSLECTSVAILYQGNYSLVLQLLVLKYRI